MTDSTHAHARGSRFDRWNASTVVTTLSFAAIVVLAAAAVFATSSGDGDRSSSTTAQVLPVLSSFDRTSTSMDPLGRQAGAAPADAAGGGSTAPGGEQVTGSGTTPAAGGGGSTGPAGGGASPVPAGGSVYFANCSAAEAAGAAPILAGEPGYRAGLDRDGDGVACEVDAGPGVTSPPPTDPPTSPPTARPTTTQAPTSAVVTTTTFVLQPTSGVPTAAPSPPD